jgi:hypothetical protein
MEYFNKFEAGFRELTSEETRFVNGGAPTKSTSFFYDVFYSASYLITHGVNALIDTGIFTAQFWVEWDEAIS